MSQPTHTEDAEMSSSNVVNQVAEHLQHTNLNSKEASAWIYFPQGTTLDEQLLILAGVEDWKLQGTQPGAQFNEADISSENALATRKQDMMTGEGNKEQVDFAHQEAMDKHHTMLASNSAHVPAVSRSTARTEVRQEDVDEYLAMLTERSFRVSTSSPSTHFPAL
ncbi:uncharacterized protein K460DRAFT_411924 [Cucurbitaria berberidis CBS 394.84]|uniref:Uncharacterized protein n=1 Tax=Cucurbitaria berberidis CBS 394.84 TaxID=1168544 RepID=A0A9P4GRX6_9PLEO|nr:uncharacterized protein K460DRAFT_411924 [Cucurbitaria berberidis CBS 394.84]KAF1850179.1 hypothetical protein K460DRAFT_411924 [Cucurbitaria berberidis CBS 394.84]